MEVVVLVVEAAAADVVDVSVELEQLDALTPSIAAVPARTAWKVPTASPAES